MKCEVCIYILCTYKISVNTNNLSRACCITLFYHVNLNINERLTGPTEILVIDHFCAEPANVINPTATTHAYKDLLNY